MPASYGLVWYASELTFLLVTNPCNLQLLDTMRTKDIIYATTILLIQFCSLCTSMNLYDYRAQQVAPLFMEFIRWNEVMYFNPSVLTGYITAKSFLWQSRYKSSKHATREYASAEKKDPWNYRDRYSRKKTHMQLCDVLLTVGTKSMILTRYLKCLLSSLLIEKLQHFSYPFDDGDIGHSWKHSQSPIQFDELSALLLHYFL